jgi:hypothetical protein
LSVGGTISLRQAHSPLGPNEARFQMEAGALLRGEVRRGASTYGVDWFEQKGWFDSLFIFRGPVENMLSFRAALRDYEQQLASIDDE